MLFDLKPYTPNEIESFTTSLGYIVQSLFYIVAGILAVLSYLQAKETIFSPIKTEIFKLQIETFQRILYFFQDKGETDFIDQFDLYQIVSLNSAEMMDAYVKLFFKDEIKVSEAARKKRKGLLIGGILYSVTNVIVPDSVSYKMEIKQDEQPTSPALILAKWQKYTHEMVGYTKQYTESREELHHLIASPTLPSELKKLLEEFGKVVDENLEQVRIVLVEVSQELPVSCKTPKDVMNFNQVYIWNKYNESRPKLEDKSLSILDYINKYLRINQLMT